MSEHDITLTVDGERAELTVEARTLLVHALREALDRTVPQVGCESSSCGACTVRVDGDAVKSCTVLAVQADGAEVTAAAGLADGDDLHPIQRAFHEAHGLQCGYCTPGMVVTTLDILEDDPDPSREAIRRELKGNVCRCTGYQNFVDAVQLAAAESTAVPSTPRPATSTSSGTSRSTTAANASTRPSSRAKSTGASRRVSARRATSTRSTTTRARSSPTRAGATPSPGRTRSRRWRPRRPSRRAP